MNSRHRRLHVVPDRRVTAPRARRRRPGGGPPALSAISNEAIALLEGAELHSADTRWLGGQLVDVMISPVGEAVASHGIVVTLVPKGGPTIELPALTLEATDAAGETHRAAVDPNGHVLLAIGPGPYRLSVAPPSRPDPVGRDGARRRGSRPSSRSDHNRRRPGWQHLAAVVAVVAVASTFAAVRNSPAVATTAWSPVRCEKTTGTSSDGHVVVAAVWAGTERERFLRVLKRFTERTSFEVSFATDSPRADRDLANTLNSYIDRGCPPDVVLLPQPGLLRKLAGEGKLLALNDVIGDLLDQNYLPEWTDQTRLPGDASLYGVPFKGAHKSLVWYNPTAFKLAGITKEPETFDQLKDAAAKLEDVGIPPFAVSGKDGWTLTDWFENVYLKMWGAARYDDLAEHRIPWTDETVTRTLAELAGLFATPGWVAGGTTGALQTTYEESVDLVFGVEGIPRAAMVMEGDFVANQLAETGAKIGVDAKFFDFPAVGDAANTGSPATAATRVAGSKAVGGDLAAVLKGRATPAAKALVRFLATPDAAEVWLEEGGFLSPNLKVKANAYPEAATHSGDVAHADATEFIFDLSDRQYPNFGSNPNDGMWRILQDFLLRPETVEETAERLEEAWTRLSPPSS